MGFKKENMINYLFIGILILVVIGSAYLINNKLTGFAVFGEYTTEADCVNAGYVWENETNQTCSVIEGCTECVSGCEGNCTECVEEVIGEECINHPEHTNQIDCENATYVWENITELNCAAIENCTECVSGCEENCTECVEEVIGGQCVGDVCDSSHLTLCDETNCDSVGQGYWYNDVCNAAAEETTPEDDEINVYRLEDNQCNSITIWENDKTGNDYNTLEQCEENIEEEIILDVVKLSAGGIENLVIPSNETKESNWVVKNIWTNTLHDCKFNSIGDFPSWINNYNETKTLDAGEEYKFVFDITIPKETEIGQYNLGLSLDCPGASKSTNFVVEVKEKKLGFELIKVERRKEEVRVFYSMEELTGEEQNVELEFLLLNLDKEKIAEVKENKTISANSTNEFKTSVPINTSLNQSLEGELNLLINLNSEIYSDSIEEVIVLGAPITGFAVLGGGTATYLVSIILIVLVLVAAYFITKKNYKKFIKE